MSEPTTDLDRLWLEMEIDALASDGPIRDADVRNALGRWRPRIEAEIRSEAKADGSTGESAGATTEARQTERERVLALIEALPRFDTRPPQTVRVSDIRNLFAALAQSEAK